MSLDASARETNIRDSIKKYLYDNLTTIEKIDLGFDNSLSQPDTTNRSTIRWVNCSFGSLVRETLSTAVIDLFCCTRNDPENYRLSQLIDTVMGYLTDSTSTDGMKKIPFYRSSATVAWTLLGGLVIQDIIESPHMEADDGTKFKILNVTWRFASKI